MTSYTFETKMCSNRWYKEATCYEWQLGFSDIINENIHVHILREYMHENDSFLEIKTYFHKKKTVEDSFFYSLNFHNIQQIQIDKLIHLCKD